MDTHTCTTTRRTKKVTDGIYTYKMIANCQVVDADYAIAVMAEADEQYELWCYYDGAWEVYQSSEDDDICLNIDGYGYEDVLDSIRLYMTTGSKVSYAKRLVD